jgi:CxxC motif-containing protein
MNMTELICIVCPRGCHLLVDKQEGYTVTGHGCPRGEAYGRAELSNPTRVLTSTISIRGARYRRCPVKTAAPIPKGLMFEALQLLKQAAIDSPVSMGQIIVENLCGTGVPLVATRDL